MCSIQVKCCPPTTVTLGPIKNNLIILSFYLSTVFQSFRAGEKRYYVTDMRLLMTCSHLLGKEWPLGFPIDILDQVWCLIVSIPDLCF